MTATSALPIPAARRPASPPAPVWIGGNMPAARLGLILSLLVPLAMLAWDARAHKLGVNAVNFAIHTTGFMAVLCLLLSLLVTPVRQLTSWNWLVQFRRSLGVYAFYYAVAHLTIYFWWDRGHNLGSTFYEITHRYYLAIGFASLSLMAPLWATSFNGAIRTVGGDVVEAPAPPGLCGCGPGLPPLLPAEQSGQAPPGSVHRCAGGPVGVAGGRRWGPSHPEARQSEPRRRDEPGRKAPRLER